VGARSSSRKHPGAAHLGPWNAPCLGPVAAVPRVETEKGCGLAKVEGTHEWPQPAQGAHGEALPKGVGEGNIQWERSPRPGKPNQNGVIIASNLRA